MRLIRPLVIVDEALAGWSEGRLQPTIPFWVGALLLILPASVMILAVLNALPHWTGFVVYLILFSLPIPASFSIIANGVRLWNAPPQGSNRGTKEPGSDIPVARGATRAFAGLVMLLGIALLGLSLWLIGSFLLRLSLG